MRALAILPAFIATFTGVAIVVAWALTFALSPDMGDGAPHAGLTGTAPESAASIALDEAQH